MCGLQMKGIGELLEGLIPYSQRHFSRVDRLERSTFLLDYTLAGMSVIEPESHEAESRNVEKNGTNEMEMREWDSKTYEGEDSETQADLKMEDGLDDNMASMKKRKSTQKSQNRKHKKTKVTYTKA